MQCSRNGVRYAYLIPGYALSQNYSPLCLVIGCASEEQPLAFCLRLEGGACDSGLSRTSMHADLIIRRLLNSFMTTETERFGLLLLSIQPVGNKRILRIYLTQLMAQMHEIFCRYTSDCFIAARDFAFFPTVI